MPTIKLTDLAPGSQAEICGMPAQPDLSMRLNELGLKIGSTIMCEDRKQIYRFNTSKFIINAPVTDQILVDNLKQASLFTNSLSSRE